MLQVKTIVKDTLAAAMLFTGTVSAQDTAMQKDLQKMQNDLKAISEQMKSINDSMRQLQENNNTLRLQSEQWEQEKQSLSQEAKAGKPGLRKFILSGSADMITLVDGETFDEGLFGASWMPVFLWQPTKKLLFEGEFHIDIEAESGVGGESGGHTHGGAIAETEAAPGGSGAMIMLGYADLVYILNDYMTLTAGKFVSPFNSFAERLHPAWINKLPDAPIGLGHHGAHAPAGEVGIQLRGGIPFGKMKMNYTAFVSNGPVLLASEEEGGKMSFENFMDNNKNKAIGGRIGLLPFSSSSLEIGGSFLTAKVGSEDTEYENIGALFYGGDVSYFKSISGFGDISLKGQWVSTGVDKANYTMDTMLMIMGTDTTYMTEYTFDNQSQAYYAQLSYKPSKSEKNFIKNLEFVVRYDAMSMPEETAWAESDTRYTFGIDYWLQARSVIKLAYQIGETQNLVMTQLVIGF